MARRPGTRQGPRRIKRYGNRRLYDSVEHRYIGRDELAELARKGVEFVVHDARTDEDLTHATLLALVTEGRWSASSAMPIEFLRELAGVQQNLVRDFFQLHLPAVFRAYVKFGDRALRAFGGTYPAGPFTPGEATRLARRPRRKARRRSSRGRKG